MNKNPEGKTFFKGMRPYLITAAAVVASYVLFTLALGAGEGLIRALMLVGVVLCGIFLLVRRLSKKDALKIETFILVVIAAGMIMRIGYMLYTPFWVRGHDIAAYDSTGHFAYMYRLFSEGALPSTNEYQFYHPPFQHIVQALVVKVFSLFQPGADPTPLFEASKIVPCFASCAMLWVCRSLCEEMKLSKRATAIALTVIAFHPTFYILSASVNNDSLMLFFFLTSVLYTIRWYYRPTMKNILVIALSIGLSMMTKLSGGMVALFTAPVFLAVLVKNWREKKWPLIGQFAAFGGVCAPLGLWYPVRNLILFDQPIGYVLTLSRTGGLYRGEVPLSSRFLSFPIDQLLNPLYCRPYDDYNIWIYTVKCSVFGEFSFDKNGAFAALLIVFNLALILVSLAAMIYVMARCKETNKFARFGLFWIWLVQMGSFIVFNLQFPYGCTMDFRYIMPTAITGAIYAGIALDHIKKKKSTAANALYYIGCAVAALFCIASVLFYAV